MKSLQLRSSLIKTINKNLGRCELKVFFCSPCKPNNIFRFKHALQKNVYPFKFAGARVVTANLLTMAMLIAIFSLGQLKMSVF